MFVVPLTKESNEHEGTLYMRFDESLISVFNWLFEFILFRFYVFLFTF